MSVQPLCLGPLDIPGYAVKKSGIVWLYPDGAWCEENQVIGFCNISLAPRAGAAQVARDATLQAALASPATGRLRADPETSFGGYLDFLGVQTWDGTAVIGFLDMPGEDEAQAQTLPMRHCLLAGKLLTGLANYGTGLLPGWHSQLRAWRREVPGIPDTILALGLCDVRGPLCGEQAAFLEYFEANNSQCHIVVTANDLLVPSALCLLEQFSRGGDANDQITRDIERSVFNGPVKPAAQDHFFAGALIEALRASPLLETHDIITAAGLGKTRPPALVILSANAEPMRILRHKTLCYHLQIHHFQFAAAGPAIRAWLQRAFEYVPRGIADIKRDYETLIAAVQARFRTKFAVINRMSSSGREDLAFYTPFDAPLSQTLAHVAAKEINIMLHELAEDGKISIVDMDAIAAELGAAQHLPDGVHQSRDMEARLRAKILGLLPPSPQPTSRDLEPHQ